MARSFAVGSVRGALLCAALLMPASMLHAQSGQDDARLELVSASEGGTAAAASTDDRGDSADASHGAEFRSSGDVLNNVEPEVRLTVAEQYLLVAANQERAAVGLPALRIDAVLSQASHAHAREMAAHENISHQFDGEPELAVRGANAGAHFSLISENVGEAPTSIIIHRMWMESQGHRENLLDPGVDSVGISVIDRDGELYAVEDFASLVKTMPFNLQERAVADVITQSGVSVANSADARVTCSMTSGYAGRRPQYILRYTASSLNDIPTQLRARLTSGRYHQAEVGACAAPSSSPFTAYNIAVLLYP